MQHEIHVGVDECGYTIGVAEYLGLILAFVHTTRQPSLTDFYELGSAGCGTAARHVEVDGVNEEVSRTRWPFMPGVGRAGDVEFTGKDFIFVPSPEKIEATMVSGVRGETVKVERGPEFRVLRFRDICGAFERGS
jgi:hypothetical protein